MAKKLDTTTVGGRIRELRQSQKMTQENLAVKLRVEKSTIAKMELGKTEPTYARLIAYAAALNTTVDYLLGNTSDPTRRDAYSTSSVSAVDVHAETNGVDPVKGLTDFNPQAAKIIDLLYHNKDVFAQDDWRLLSDNISNYIRYLKKKR